METLIQVWDRLHSTIASMALGDKPVRERLKDAVTYQLDAVLVAPDVEGMPEDLQERIKHLHKKLIEKGSYRETISEMEYIQIVSVIEEIISLFHDVSIAFERSK
jgi:cellobiose-specific phosphotransferase system component IIB